MMSWLEQAKMRMDNLKDYINEQDEVGHGQINQSLCAIIDDMLRAIETRNGEADGLQHQVFDQFGVVNNDIEEINNQIEKMAKNIAENSQKLEKMGYLAGVNSEKCCSHRLQHQKSVVSDEVKALADQISTNLRGIMEETSENRAKSGGKTPKSGENGTSARVQHQELSNPELNFDQLEGRLQEKCRELGTKFLTAAEIADIINLTDRNDDPYAELVGQIAHYASTNIRKKYRMIYQGKIPVFPVEDVFEVLSWFKENESKLYYESYYQRNTQYNDEGDLKAYGYHIDDKAHVVWHARLGSK